jgi:hypothetical protein
MSQIEEAKGAIETAIENTRGSITSWRTFSRSGVSGWYGGSHDRVTCTPLFTAALITIAELWRQPRCPRHPRPDEWVKKMWYLYTVELYSDIKKNEIMLFAGKWMERENLMLNKVSQAPKNQRLHILFHM